MSCECCMHNDTYMQYMVYKAEVWLHSIVTYHYYGVGADIMQIASSKITVYGI